MTSGDITVTLTIEQARVLTGAARYMSKKKRKEAKKKPFIPRPGHYNLNERNADLLYRAAKTLQTKLDEKAAPDKYAT